MIKFDFYITSQCNSNCKFCCVHDKLVWFQGHELRASLTLDEIRVILARKRQAGYDYVCFTGGEPSIHPDFVNILAFAKKLGFRTSVNSNMYALADRAYCEAVLENMDEVVASVHGHNAALHEELTGVKGGFRKLVAALDNIENSKQEIYLLTDTVMLNDNINNLTDVIDFVSRYSKLRQILFSNVNIPPDGIEKLKHIVPKLPDIKKVLPSLYNEVVTKRNLILRYYGLPFCILGQYQMCSSDLYFEPKKVIERSLENDVMIDRESEALKPTMAKLRPAKCRPCIYYEVCGGYFRSYDAIYGDAHVKPVLKK